LIASVLAAWHDPTVLLEVALVALAIAAIRRWGGAIIDVGDMAIRYHLPRILRIPARRATRSTAAQAISLAKMVQRAVGERKRRTLDQSNTP
jgi:hypothetical protein